MDDNMVLVGLISLLLGLIALFFGYRIFRPVLLSLAFIFGFGLAGTALGDTLTDETTLIVASVVGGVLLALLVNALYFIGLGVLGASAGYVAMVFLLGTGIINVDVSDTVWLVLGAAVGVGVALSARRVIIIALTAFLGAAGAIYGMATIFQSDVDTNLLRDGVPLREITTEIAPAILVVWLVAVLIGVSFQWRTTDEPET